MLMSRVACGCLMTSTTIGSCCRKSIERCLQLTPLADGQGQLRQRANADAGGTLRQVRLRIFDPRGAGDIDVDPRQIAREFLDEQRAGYRAAGTSAGVPEVGDFA